MYVIANGDKDRVALLYRRIVESQHFSNCGGFYQGAVRSIREMAKLPASTSGRRADEELLECHRVLLDALTLVVPSNVGSSG